MHRLSVSTAFNFAPTCQLSTTLIEVYALITDENICSQSTFTPSRKTALL